MSVLFVIFMGFLVATALLVVLCRLNIKRIVGYPVLADLTATVLFCILMAGTLTGMSVAIVAGLVFSFTVTAIRKLFGYEKFNLATRSWVCYPRTINA